MSPVMKMPVPTIEPMVIRAPSRAPSRRSRRPEPAWFGSDIWATTVTDVYGLDLRANLFDSSHIVRGNSRPRSRGVTRGFVMASEDGARRERAYTLPEPWRVKVVEPIRLPVRAERE